MAQHADLQNWLEGRCAELSEGATEKLSTLIEVKSGIGALDEDARRFLARNSDLNVFFSLVNDTDSNVTEAATDVIYMLLHSLSNIEAFSQYHAQFSPALSKNNRHVRRTFLKLLQEHITAESLVVLSNTHPDIFVCIINCLACPDRSVAEGAVVLFKQIGRSQQGIQLIYSNNLLEILKSAMAVDDICRFRMYEIVIDIAVNSSEGLQAGHNCGLLPSLLNELKSDDTLIQLNVLELLTNFTANRDALVYLQREGVIKYLVDRLVSINNEPLSFILLPGLIEFFGNLYKIQPTVFSQQHPEVLQLLIESFETVDPALLGVVISTLGKIGCSADGKRVLIAQGDTVNVLFKKFGSIITRKDELCVTAMNSLSVLLSTEDLTLGEATEIWFDALGTQALETIVTNSKLPFVEVRLSALCLLGAISSQGWGVKRVCLFPGLLEFLLDRNAEFDKHCKDTKFNVVKTLSTHPAISSTVSSNIVLKLRQFVNEGPFYVPTEPALSFEGA